MRNGILAAAALAAVFTFGAPADKAAAMMSATPSELGLADSGNNVVEKAALVCGRFGCRRVWTGRRLAWGARRVWWGARRVAWRSGVWWGARRAAWRSRWWAARTAWASNPVWWGGSPVGLGPRPLFAYAGASPGWGWSSPGLTVGFGGWGPGLGWSSWGGPGLSVGWGGWGWRRGWGWNTW